jgi:glycine/D-amino acid oxidase-like deaminating enzyme
LYAPFPGLPIARGVRAASTISASGIQVSLGKGPAPRNGRPETSSIRTTQYTRTPLGYDADQPGFFWLAALGGYGIQTAPALSRLAAALVLKIPIDDHLAAFGVDARKLAPERMASDRRA